MTLLIVDSDHISYRSAASCEPTKAKPFLETKDDAIARVDMMMDGLAFVYNGAHIESYIAGSGNWRKAIYPEYKANRNDKPRPTYLEDTREYLVTKYKASIVNDREVDDLCGIRMTQEAGNKDKVVCVSLDKDLQQLPGWHYNFVKQIEKFVTPLDGLISFYKQIITGDASDNIPSFDGKFRNALPKFVEQLLLPIEYMDEEKDMWEYVETVYSEQGFPEETSSGYKIDLAIRNASILYVQRDWEDKWLPPGQQAD